MSPLVGPVVDGAVAVDENRIVRLDLGAAITFLN